MRVSRFIVSFLQFFVVFSFFSLALFLIALPFLPHIRFQVSNILLSEESLLFYPALFSLSLSLLFFFGFYGPNRGRLLYIEMGKHPIGIDKKVIVRSIEECLKTHFPNDRLELADVEIISGKHLDIGLVLQKQQAMPSNETFLLMEQQLQHLFREKFKFTKPFSVTLQSIR